VSRALDLGALRVVVGSRLIEDPGFGETLLKTFLPQQVVASIDVDLAGRARLRGWREAGPAAPELWLTLYQRGFVIANVTDISRDGTLTGIREEFWRLWAAMPGQIGAGGGIRSRQDVEALAAWGLHHAVVGKAWLEGRIRLEDFTAPTPPPQT